ncbi:hypothetical protein [Bordetella genomosp. 9]|uniref:hypothetical protein n=1 Tax=Bordetella genomosp. 9 TaxID=1416803 RepID=UPI0012FCA1A2|nr:hypothetical protein [Bordetella genomosp. 9]
MPAGCHPAADEAAFRAAAVAGMARFIAVAEIIAAPVGKKEWRQSDGFRPF